MTMITPSYLGETIEYSSLHACRSTLEDPTPQCAETSAQADPPEEPMFDDDAPPQLPWPRATAARVIRPVVSQVIRMRARRSKARSTRAARVS